MELIELFPIMISDWVLDSLGHAFVLSAELGTQQTWNKIKHNLLFIDIIQQNLIHLGDDISNIDTLLSNKINIKCLIRLSDSAMCLMCEEIEDIAHSNEVH